MFNESERTSKRMFWLLSALCLISQVMFTLGFAAFAIYGEKRVDLKRHLIENLREYYPWIDTVAWVSTPDWVPHIYESKKYTPKELLLRITKAQESRIQYLSEKKLSHDKKSVFFEYLLPWSERVRLCQGYRAQFEKHITKDCAAYDMESMPKEWLAVFRDHLFTEMYFYLRNGFVETHNTQEGSLLTCNLTPVSVQTVSAQTAFSAKLMKTYERLGLDSASRDLFENLGWFSPGECKTTPVRKYDTEISVFFSSVEKNDQITRFVNRELEKGTSRRGKNSPETLFVCSKNGSESFAEIVTGSCKEGDGYQLTSLALREESDKLSYQAMINHPLLMFLDYKKFNGHSWTNSQISTAQKESEKYANIAITQWELHKKWHSKVSYFLLPAELDNRYGALRPGVYYKDGRSVNYYRELLDIPNQGHLVGINDREVWSVFDIYEELEHHGFSRSAGIKVPVTLAVAGYDRLFQTRYIFNQSNLPYFIENRNGFIDGFIQDLTWGQEWVSCGATNFVKGLGNIVHLSFCGVLEWVSDNENVCRRDKGDVFEYEDIGECSWKRTQQWAFASQVHPGQFEFGQVVSWFMPIGTTALRIFKGQKLSKSSTFARALSYGTAEALDNAFIEFGTIKPGAPFDEKMKNAWIPAGLGFVSGAIFYPK